MNDDQIRSMLQRLPRSGGLLRLINALGFNASCRRMSTRTLRTPARALYATSRETLHLHVLDLRGDFTALALRDLVSYARTRQPLTHHVLILTEPRRTRVVVACDIIAAGTRHVVLEPGGIRNSDIDLVRDLLPLTDENGTAAALRIHHALDRRRLTSRFFRDIRAVRDTIARAFTGLPAAAPDRDALALLLLSRLVFLYFLQRRRLLAHDQHFLPRLLARWQRRPGRHGSFYRLVLRTLFFGVLNRRPERRTARARTLGTLPYLNGGLFEKHPLELRYTALDLPDSTIATVFESLLEKYRFTSSDTAWDNDSAGSGIDPEMLGRIFEGLMPSDRRSTTGTFYTPAAAVDSLVLDTLTLHLSACTGIQPFTIANALRRDRSDASDTELRLLADASSSLRILDPACGSGAFLLGALNRLGAVHTGGNHAVVAATLHGVDLLDDAALICSLRLWLALIPDTDRIEDVPPLPNLDRRIRQGDALIDPLDIGAPQSASPSLRRITRRLEPAALAYLSSEPDSRAALRRKLRRLELRLARAWIDTALHRLNAESRELTARAHDHDLFGKPSLSAIAARRHLPSLAARASELDTCRARLDESAALPFFSFRVHFAAVEGFDIIISNPPWIRAHNWPASARRLLRERYRVCSDAGWPRARTVVSSPHTNGHQTDLAFLFLERSLDLLRPGGTLGIMLPAKLLRSLAPGGARSLLLTTTALSSIEDHSLDQSAIFDADAFTTVITARKRPDPASETSPTHTTDTSTPISVRMTGRNRPTLEFHIAQEELPLVPGDAHAPWLIAPRDCADALRSMQHAGTPLGSSFTIRRGIMTGANDVMVARSVEPKLGDIAHIRTEGWYRHDSDHDRRACSAYVEASTLRPLLRGTDIQPWHTTIQRHILYSPLNDDPRAVNPPRLASFLRRHRNRLNQPDHLLGTLQRLPANPSCPRVVWPDLALDLRAAAVPGLVRTCTGLDMPAVPLNTAYFITTPDDDTAILIAGLLNSLPIRTFARAIAERAKDAHFRFFAWTVASLPLPHHWQHHDATPRIADISREAHAAGSISPTRQNELDLLAASMYGLDDLQSRSLASFDAWLRGNSTTLAAHP